MKSLFLVLFLLPGIWSSGIKSASKFTLDEKPVVRIDDHLQGIWKLAEDTNYHNYFIVEKDGNFQYSITYMNRGGDNRGLEHGMFFFSEINGVKFINIGNWDDEHPGYILLKINEIGTPRSWSLTASIVTDMSITKVTSRKELRALLEKNLNNASFYGKELHFKKKFEFNSFR
jgi:hypothetical protein